MASGLFHNIMTIVKLKGKEQKHKSALVLSQAGRKLSPALGRRVVGCAHTAGGPGPPVPRETRQARGVATGTCEFLPGVRGLTQMLGTA